MNEFASAAPAAHGDDTERSYLPGMGRDWLLPLYDPFTRLIGAKSAHRKLAEQAELSSAERVLEIGCGTGNLALQVKRLRPQIVVVGLDPDPKALARAGRKAGRAGLTLEFDRGFADELPYPDGSFDRVLSALMFHHLEAQSRVATLREVRRVLRPGGRLHLMDIAGDSRHMHGLARFARHSPTVDDRPDDRILAQMREAGFGDAAQTGHLVKRVGRLEYYRGTRAE